MEPCAFRRSDTCNLWGYLRRVDQLSCRTCQKVGEPDLFESKVAAHATADIGSNVARAPKRVRLPPSLMPVTHLLFSFPSCCESSNSCPGVVVARFQPPRAKPPGSMPFCPDLDEASRLFPCQKVENRSNLDQSLSTQKRPWSTATWGKA